eukprot:2637196-Rhodomonas_salina.1
MTPINPMRSPNNNAYLQFTNQLKNNYQTAINAMLNPNKNEYLELTNTCNAKMGAISVINKYFHHIGFLIDNDFRGTYNDLLKYLENNQDEIPTFADFLAKIKFSSDAEDKAANRNYKILWYYANNNSHSGQVP